MQLVFLPLSAVFLFEEQRIWASDHPRALAFRLLLMLLVAPLPLGLGALYALAVRLELRHGRGLSALWRLSEESEAPVFLPALLGLPYLFFAGWSPMIWSGHQRALWLDVLLELLVLSFPLICYGMLWQSLRNGEEDEGGGPGTGDGPEPEPPWWPGFEDQFRRYARKRERPLVPR